MAKGSTLLPAARGSTCQPGKGGKREKKLERARERARGERGRTVGKEGLKRDRKKYNFIAAVDGNRGWYRASQAHQSITGAPLQTVYLQD